ncbi:MAG: tape measure protein [Tenacibaculum sp.]|nr:tape measure protein [Tenacibaculum sp.]
MNSTNGALDFQARLDIEQLRRDIDRMKAEFEGVTRKVTEEGGKTQQVINNLLKGAGAIFTIQKAQEFAGEIFRVRSEFQALQVSFETMLGSKAKADALMSQVVEFASKTPFQLSEVAGGTKSLLAYRIEQEKIIPTLKALGDVSAGLDVPIQRLILNYGQVKTASKLTGRELRDFNMAGVPLIAELSKNLNKSQNEINDMVSAGKIGFKEVEEAFRTMSSAGGQFADLMDKQSQTLQGRYSNLQDNIEKMFNELGKSSEGVFNSALDGAGYLVENYEKVGKEIGGLIIAYGSYKTALMVTLATQRLVNTAGVYDVATKKLQIGATLKAIATQNKLNFVMRANPYLIVATAVAGLTYAIYKTVTAQTELELAQDRLNKRIKEQEELANKEREELQKLVGVIKDETTTRFQKQEALAKLQKQFPSIFKNMDIEAIKIANITKLLKKQNEQRRIKNAQNDDEQLAKLKKDLKNYTGYRDGAGPTKEKLESDIKVLEDKIRKREELKEKTRFDSLPDEDKITELEDKNERLRNDLVNNEHKFAVKDLLEKQILENEKLIKGYKSNIEKAKNTILTSAKDLNKQIAEQDKIIKPLRIKFNTEGLNEKEKDAYKEAIEKKKALQKELNGYNPESKSSKNSKDKPTFDYEKNDRDNKRKLQDLANQNRQAEINAMREGAEKTLAQLKLDGKLKLQAITRQKEDEIQRIKDAEKKKAEVEGKNYDPTKGNNQINEVENIFKDIEAQTKNQNKENEQKYYEDLLKDYQTYEQQKDNIRKKYAEQREALKGQDYDKQKLNDAEAKEILEVEKKAGGTKSIISLMFSDLGKKSTEELRKISDNVTEFYNALTKGEWSIEIQTKFGVDEKTFNTLKKSPNELKKIRTEQEKLETSTRTFSESFKTLFKKDAGVQELEDSIANVTKKINGGISALNTFSSALGSIGKITGGGIFSNIANGLSSVTGIASNVMSGASMGKQAVSGLQSLGLKLGKSAGPWGMAIGAGLGLVTGVLGKIASAEKKHREALRKIQQSNIAQQRVYNHLLFEQKMLMKDAENIFGVDALGKALGYLALYNQKIKELQDKLTKKEVVNKWFGFQTKSWKSELDKIQIKTGHKKTGLFGWGRGKDTYSSITEKYDDLIDKEGKLNIVRAQSILQTQQMRSEDKEALQEIIQLYKETEEAQKQFDEYLKSTFGELGGGMMDSIVKSLKTGEDAFESFSKNVGNVMMKLGKQMVFNSVLKPYLDSLNKKIKNAYEDEKNIAYKTEQGRSLFGYKKNKKIKDEKATLKNITNDVVGIIGNSIGEMKNRMEVGKAGLEAFNENVKKMTGIDVFTEEQKRQATQKGFASMTQDQASSLESKFTLSNELDRQQLTVAKEISTGIKFMQQHSAQSLKHLAGIETNTARLQKIQTDISSVKSGIETINDKGIKMRR